MSWDKWIRLQKNGPWHVLAHIKRFANPRAHDEYVALCWKTTKAANPKRSAEKPQRGKFCAACIKKDKEMGA